MSDASPAILQRYRVVRRIAMGGMAEVFLAELTGAGGFKKQVAIKRILPQFAQEPRFVEMFLDEARLAALFHHPNLVQIYELGELDGMLCMVMEYVRGASLSELYRRSVAAGQGMPSLAVAARIVQQAAEGLDYAHNFQDPETGEPLGLVHRDVSPQNILIAREGTAKVMDFGIAKAVGNIHHTSTGQLKGKLAYMSPEQLNGQTLDRRGDVWALGVVLYELVAGKRPFSGESEASVFRKILIDPLPPVDELRPDVPAKLRQVIFGAMERDPAKRIQTAGAIAQGIEDWLREDGIRVGANDVSEWVKGLLPAGGIDPVTGGPAAITPSQPGARPGTQPGSQSKVPVPISSPAPSASDVRIEVAEGSDWGAPLELPSKDVETRTADSRALFLAPPAPLPPLQQFPSSPGFPPAQVVQAARSPWPFIAVGAIVVAGGVGLVAALHLTTGAAQVTPAPLPAPAPVTVAATPPPVAQPVTPPVTTPQPAPAPAAPLAAAAHAAEHSGDHAKAHPPKLAHHPATPALQPAAAAPAPTPIVVAAQPTQAQADLMGTLVINTEPWSRVSIDGRDVGETPLQAVALTAGTHAIVCVNPDTGLTHRETITVRPGERIKKFVPLGK